MRLVRARNVLCLALALTVTFLLGPMALAAPAGEDFRLAAQFEGTGDKCANPANGTGSFAVTTFDEPSLVALQHHGGHRHHCERARHRCWEQCRHHHHGGHHHHNCVRHCMRNHGCHHD